MVKRDGQESQHIISASPTLGVVTPPSVAVLGKICLRYPPGQMALWDALGSIGDVLAGLGSPCEVRVHTGRDPCTYS